MRNSKLNLVNVISAIAYVVLIGLLIFNIFGLNDKYDKEDTKMVVNVEREMRTILEENSDDEIIASKLEALRKEYDFDIVVLEGEDTVYSSVPFESREALLDRVHSSVVSRESQGPFKYNTDRDFYVWYSIYKLNDTTFIQTFLMTVLIITILSTLLIALTVFLIYRTLFNPLKLIEQSIDLAEEYQFEDIHEQEDEINKKFKRFTNRLQNNISTVSREHTRLEKQLQSKREHLNNTIVVSRSMVHDLKTPLHQNMLENEKVQRNTNNQEVIDITTKNQEVAHEVMMEINTILKMLKSEQNSSTLEITNVNLVQLISKGISRVGVSINEKGLYMNFDSPEELYMEVEEAAMILLINNLLSNMVNYSIKDTELNILLEKKSNEIKMKFHNKASKLDIERMKSTEQLFRVLEDPKEGNHVYSSGNGLYLIKDLTEMLGGKYSLILKGNDVTIEVIFNHEK